MMRGLALDLKPIRVNLVGSGGVDTEMWDLLEGEAREGVLTELARQRLRGRLGMWGILQRRIFIA
jgi:NAD(P)-dependent dehydrogenase (short-subunit alcohol dehydrogenase family)